jgi:hypothetical protein
MIPAEIKKKENIAEYIIHMYQTEDLILTYEFNLNEILEYVIKHMTKDQEKIKSLLLWYADIIGQMQEENVHITKERLRSTQQYVDVLTDLHKELLKDDSAYKQCFEEAEADINKQIDLSNGLIENPIQICINGVYGLLLIKLKGKDLSAEQKSMVDKFGKVLAFLSEVYSKRNSD